MSESTSRATSWAMQARALREPVIEGYVSAGSSLIDAAARECGLDARYLGIQVRMHLPFYASQDLEGDLAHFSVLQRILDILRQQRVDVHAAFYAQARLESGIPSLPGQTHVADGGAGPLVRRAGDSELAIPLEFAPVSDDLGDAIQQKLHYIHSARTDTVGHFGLFMPGRSVPICYGAVSVCDRAYQLHPLKRVVRVSDDGVLVLTRAYSFPPLPKNTMSKFFQLIARHYGMQREYGALITALNPLVGFKGSTFFGSSFIPFATSPMQYRYSQEGLYVNRRSPLAVVEQKMNTPPIVWLARGLIRPIQRVLDGNVSLYEVTPDEYANG